VDDVGNGRIETGNSMADWVPGSGTRTGRVPGSKDPWKSEHYLWATILFCSVP